MCLATDYRNSESNWLKQRRHVFISHRRLPERRGLQSRAAVKEQRKDLILAVGL